MNTTHGSLLGRLRDRQDGEAWHEFDAVYRSFLYRYARRRGLAHADAEDIVQQCMAAIANQIDRFDYDRDRGRFRDWLRTLVNRRIYDMLNAINEIQAETRDLSRTQQTESPPDEMFDRLWEQAHLSRCVELVRSEVDPATFQAFDCYVIREWPVERVCQALGMNAQQVYTIKWRITRRLRTKMSELLDGTYSRSKQLSH